MKRGMKERGGGGVKEEEEEYTFTFLPLLSQSKDWFCYKMDGMLTEWAFKIAF